MEHILKILSKKAPLSAEYENRIVTINCASYSLYLRAQRQTSSQKGLTVWHPYHLVTAEAHAWAIIAQLCCTAKMKFYGTVFNFLLFGWSCLSLRYHHSSIRHNFSGLISRQKQPKADQSLRFHAKLSDSTVVCLDSFVECFELQNWGLFEHSVLTLGSAPLFAVITGETGSGKSVLVSALQYLYSNSGIF